MTEKKRNKWGWISLLFMLAVFLVIGRNFYQASREQKKQKVRLSPPKLPSKAEKAYPDWKTRAVKIEKYLVFLNNRLPGLLVPEPKQEGLREELLLKFNAVVKEMTRRKFPLEVIQEFENLEFAKAVEIFDKDLQAETPPPNRPISAYYLGHIESLMLKFGESAQYYLRAVSDDLDNQPDYKRELANAFFLQSNYRDANQFFREVLVVYQKEPEKYFDSLVYTYNNLGEIQYKIKEYVHALDYFQEALKSIRRKEPADGIMALSVLKKIGKTYKGLGNLPKATRVYQDALHIGRKSFSDSPAKLAFLLNKLGVTELSSGHSREAYKNFLEAVELGRKNLEAEDPTLAIRLVNLGGALKALGKNREALKNFQEAYRIFYKRLGEGHLSTKTAREWMKETKQVLDPSFKDS